MSSGGGGGLRVCPPRSSLHGTKQAMGEAGPSSSRYASSMRRAEDVEGTQGLGALAWSGSEEA